MHKRSRGCFASCQRPCHGALWLEAPSVLPCWRPSVWTRRSRPRRTGSRRRSVSRPASGVPLPNRGAGRGMAGGEGGGGDRPSSSAASSAVSAASPRMPMARTFATARRKTSHAPRHVSAATAAALLAPANCVRSPERPALTDRLPKARAARAGPVPLLQVALARSWLRIQ